MYGEGAQGLSDSRGLSLEEAKATIKKVMKAMPQIDQTNQLVQRFVKKTGFVETIAGHVRRLPEATQGADKRARARSIRQSFNAVVQGSGAFCTNTAIILIRNIFRKYHLKSKLVITVHDSVVIDCHPDEIPMVPQLVQKIMQSLPIKQFILEKKDFPTLKIDPKYMINDHQFRFPLFAEISWGKTYADGLDMDFGDLKKLGIEKYYEYSMKCKYVSDTYNTQLASEDNDDKKAKIVKKRDAKLAEIRQKYFK